MDLYKKIAEKLKNSRINAGFGTAKDFAKKYNIPYITYAQHESGKRRMSAKAMIKYTKLLKKNSNYFLEDIDDENGLASVRIVGNASNVPAINYDLFMKILNHILKIQHIKKESLPILKCVKNAISAYNYHISSNEGFGENFLKK